MSQEKVDRYKQEKANRKQNMAKEKLKKKLYVAAGAVIGALAIVWIGFSFYWEAEQKKKDEIESSSLAELYSSYFDSILNGTSSSTATSTTGDDNTSSSSETTSGEEQSSENETTTPANAE